MGFYDRIKRLLKDDFNRNFATLFSGSVIAQIIPLLASILLARIYGPAEFGVLAIFTSIVMIFSSVVNLRYEFAIPLAKDDNEAVTVVLLSGLVAIILSALLTLIFLLFQQSILALIGGEELGNWLFLVPLALLLSGIYNCLNYFSIRFKKYRVIAKSNIVRSSSNAGLQMALGLLYAKFPSLLIGYVVSLLFGNSQMLKGFWRHKEVIKRVTIAEIKGAAFRFRKFPLISIWGIFLNNLSVNINNFFISRFFGPIQLGLYSYSYRYINAPLSLISSNMGQLFYQVCADKAKSGEKVDKEFIATLKKLLIICIPLFLVLYFIIEELFAFAFGEEWRMAGTYAKILIPLFFIRTVFGPVSLINAAFEKQVLALGMQFLIFFVNISILFYTFYNKITILDFLHLYTTCGILVYIVLVFVCYLVASRKI